MTINRAKICSKKENIKNVLRNKNKRSKTHEPLKISYANHGDNIKTDI